MSAVSDYRIFSSYRLIYLNYSGETNLEDLKLGIKKMSADPEYSPNFNLITDISNCTLHVQSPEVNNFFNYMKYDLRNIGDRKSAFISNSANEYVLSMILSIYFKQTPIKPEIFSNIEDALIFTIEDNSEMESINKKLLEFIYNLN